MVVTSCTDHPLAELLAPAADEVAVSRIIYVLLMSSVQVEMSPQHKLGVT